MNDLRYKLAGPHISSDEFDDEYVVLNLESGRYYSLAGGAAILWRAVLAGHNLNALGHGLPANGTARTAFETCLANLQASGLIAPDAVSGTDAPELIPQLMAVEADYRVESFDDLANLLLADPIHDVETGAGWPHRAD